MQNNKKTYVEFFGLPGSGKTTICNALANKLKEEGVDVIFQKKEFMKRGKFYRHTVPIFYTIFKLRFNVFKFLFYILFNFRDRYNIEGMLRYFFLHKFFINSFSKSKVFLSDQGIINSIDTRELDSRKTKEILDFYPKNREIFFIFVNVSSPEVLFKRKFEKEKDNIKKMNRKQLNFCKKMLNNHTVNEKSWNREEIFNFLKVEEKENVTIKKIIKINGENPIEENVKFLKKQLNEDINA